MLLISSCSCLYPIRWSQVLSWEWRCSWSSACRCCSNYIWVINNLIAYWSASYIRDLTVHQIKAGISCYYIYIFCGTRQGSVVITSIFYVGQGRDQLLLHLYFLWDKAGTSCYYIYIFCGTRQGSAVITSIYSVGQGRDQLLLHLYFLWDKAGISCYYIYIFCGTRQGSVVITSIFSVGQGRD